MPEPDPAIRCIAIIGPGLIGGSFALAVRKAGFTGEILGIGSSPYVEEALALSVIDRVSTLNEAAAVADLLYVSDIVDGILETISSLGPILRPECLVTDVGSTKRVIVESATLHLHGAEFVGGHPMAGKELRGVQNADADLFRGRPYILTSAPVTPRAREFASWLNAIGAEVSVMSAAMHDQTVAYSSHLPQLLSTALAVTLARKPELPVAKVFGPGLLDTTRLALSSPALWAGILRTNKDEVGAALDDYIRTVTLVRDQLADSDVTDIFNEGASYAYSLRAAR